MSEVSQFDVGKIQRCHLDPLRPTRASVPKIIGLVGAFLRQLLVRLYTERRMNIFQQ